MKFFFSGGAVGEFALFARDHGISCIRSILDVYSKYMKVYIVYLYVNILLKSPISTSVEIYFKYSFNRFTGSESSSQCFLVE